jgi:hypothetical protein
MKIPYEDPIAVGLEVIELEPDVVAAILVTLHAGWEYASTEKDVHADAGEVTITEHLRDGMRRASKSLRWGKTLEMVILPGTESRSRPDVVLPDGRTDIPILVIQIFLRLQEHDPHAIIECKRIACDDTHLCREYVVEGIDRFQAGKYGAKHTMGLMAGYLVAKDATAAVVGINAYLTRKRRKAEHLGPSDLLPDTWAWRSRHPRERSPQPINLHHAFVALAPAPPPD